MKQKTRERLIDIGMLITTIIIIIVLTIICLNYFGETTFNYCCEQIGGELFFNNSVKDCSVSVDYCEINLTNLIGSL